MPPNLSILLQTTLTLSDQFQSTLSPQTSEDASVHDSKVKKDTPEPLPLLSASAAALKSQTTKLSLLAITTPFTESAIATVLTAVNDSVLPSLVTAGLLVNAETHTTAFVSEVKVLSKTLLRELSSLVQEVKRVADQKLGKTRAEEGKEELSQAEKNVITSATGRVWDACDTLTGLANQGVVGFVVQKVQQWRDLVKDAIEELEDWDPKDDGSGDDDFLIEGDEENVVDGYDEKTAATLREFQKSALRVLKPTAQIYPAIISHRLKKGGLVPSSSSGTAFRIPSPVFIPKLESLISDLQLIPEYVDEAAGLLYESNLPSATSYIKKVKDAAARAMSSVRCPWGAADNEQNEDKFMTFARTWFNVIDEVMKSMELNSGE